MTKRPYILDDDATIPMLAWIWPSAEVIRPDVMKSLVEAGFNICLADFTGDVFGPALDIAHQAGLRLLVRHPAFDLGRLTPEQGRDFVLSAAQQSRIRSVVKKLKNHPGLYGYYIHDEPAQADYNWTAAVIREIEALDDYHLCYVNHNAPVIQGGYGAGTQEALWREWIRKTQPRFLSYDHYPIEQKPRHLIAALGANPFNAFPGGIVVKSHYFSALDFARSFCMALDLPLWAFTCAAPHWSYPVPTEGHIRFQLMCDLAYGARGLQYFAPLDDRALLRTDGSPAPTWDLARRVNREIHALWKKMKNLRSIGVHHHGPLWPGTTPLLPTPIEAWGIDHLGLKVKCEGDPAVLGLFDDPSGNLYVLAVNRNPVESGAISLDPSLDDQVPHKWHPLLPGEGKLFKLRPDGPPEAI